MGSALRIADVTHSRVAGRSRVRERAKNAAYFFEKTFGRRDIPRIQTAKVNVCIFEQPLWKTAHFPFRARIGARSQNYPQALFLTGPFQV